MFKLSVVKVDTKIINSSVFGLKSSFKTNFIGFKTLDFLDKNINSVFLKSIFFFKSSSFSSFGIKLAS